jgi:type I restriction enzyme M protein
MPNSHPPLTNLKPQTPKWQHLPTKALRVPEIFLEDIAEFADSAGKKGGEFYTPRAVVQLMVRLVQPQEGMSVYDPCVGSGGMLIQSKQYVEECGANSQNLALYGQDNNGGVWAICKINMLLHGIRDADIQNEDTLFNPLHVHDGELIRFDRVLSNPPFSQNYTREGIKFPGRFTHGYCPESGKKGDLMFAQHIPLLSLSEFK